jgi:peptidoglycan/xylan/chitin deacetylase (PgdA/CDA1 family)
LIDFYHFVYPIISEKRIPVVLFMNVSFLNQPGYLTMDQLLEISGCPYVTIGSHCINHLPMNTLADKEKKIEIFESKKQLEKIVCKNIDYIAYPFGQYDKNVLKFVAESKYKKGFSAAEFDRPRLMYRNFCLSRIDITNERINQWL